MSCQSRFFAVKDPNAVRWYGVDWTDDLASGVTVVSSEWVVPTGITEESDQLVSPIASIKLSGGTVGLTYEVVNRVTFSTGEVDDRTILFEIRER